MPFNLYQVSDISTAELPGFRCRNARLLMYDEAQQAWTRAFRAFLQATRLRKEFDRLVEAVSANVDTKEEHLPYSDRKRERRPGNYFHFALLEQCSLQRLAWPCENLYASTPASRSDFLRGYRRNSQKWPKEVPGECFTSSTNARIEDVPKNTGPSSIYIVSIVVS